MSRTFNMLLSVFLLMGLLLAPAGNAAAQAPEKGILAAPAPNLILDPSLQASYHVTTIWQQSSDNADWTVCTTSNVDCLLAGVAGPRTGTRWGMFGIPDWEDPETINPEVATLSQVVTFPGCGASLQFYLWIGQADAGSGADDVFNVKIDGNTVFTTNATQKASYSAYTLVTVDVSSYANGAARTLLFHSVTSDQAVIFNLDDISLLQTCATISGNAGIGGATMDYTGGSTVADGNGDYSIDVAYDWTGTVTPSKLGYTFNPPSRSYTNLIANATGQNYVATAPTISGNAGVAGVTLDYTDGAPKTATTDANGDYSFSVSGDWTGTVTPSHPCYTFTPLNRPYANVIADQTAQDYSPTPVPAAGCSEINVDIADANEGIFPISSQGTLTQKSFPGINTGPAKIYSTAPILAGNRAIYKVKGVPVSFSEMIGLPDNQLDKIYWLPWYNNKTLDTQLRFANLGAAQATIHVTIDGVDLAGSPFMLDAGAITKKSFSGIDKGPLKIESTENIVVAERVIYTVNGKQTSFSEMMALPANQVDKVFWLPWYNSKFMDSQLRIANVSGTDATIHVKVGGVEVQGSPFPLGMGKSDRKTFPNIDKGPVQIESDQDIVVAQRVFYTVNGVSTSFSQTMALPNKVLESTYWLPSYNSKIMDSQLRIANVDATDATVHVYMGGSEITGSPFVVPAGKSVRKIFPGLNLGLVKIESENSINIMVSERVIYKVKGVATSYSEIMGLPAGQLDTIYWLPVYNNVNLDTSLRFGLP